jgi:hypothetical protein
MTSKKTSSKKKLKKRDSKKTAPAAPSAKAKKEKRRKRREDLEAFHERMKKFGQDLVRKRRMELEESKKAKRILL